MDVPAPAAGVVKEMLVSVGDKVSQGRAADDRGADAGAAVDAVEPPVAEAPAAEPPALAEPAPAAEPTESPHRRRPRRLPTATLRARPARRRSRAGPLGIQPRRNRAGSSRRCHDRAGPASGHLRQPRRCAAWPASSASICAASTGSGRKGRITKEDVEQAAARRRRRASGAAAGPPGLDLLPWPTVDFEKFGPVERVARSRIQRISAPNLARNWVMIPHVTHNDEADITELEAWRKQLNAEQGDVKVTMVSFLVRRLRRGAEGVPRPSTPRSTATSWSSSATTTSASRPTPRAGWWCR